MNEPRPLALVTGGVRRLGAAIAQRLAEAGYTVAVSSHETGPAIPHGLTHWDADAFAFQADLSVPDAPARLMADVIDHFGRAPVLLVNNAAMFGQDDAESMTADTFDAHMALNFRAPVLLTQALAALGNPASVVHITDQRVRNPVVDQLSYTLAKQALDASVRTMARALAPLVRVNAVAPGLTLATSDYDEGTIAASAAAMPLHRLPAANDIADAALFLARAKSITGQTIFVDCGANLESFRKDFMNF
jgi:NAD(P)-dependent dehydrogenase (short-subunit alcohol dehydrogenase family)